MYIIITMMIYIYDLQYSHDTSICLKITISSVIFIILHLNTAMGFKHFYAVSLIFLCIVLQLQERRVPRSEVQHGKNQVQRNQHLQSHLQDLQNQLQLNHAQVFSRLTSYAAFS